MYTRVHGRISVQKWTKLETEQFQFFPLAKGYLKERSYMSFKRSLPLQSDINFYLEEALLDHCNIAGATHKRKVNISVSTYRSQVCTQYLDSPNISWK